MGVVIKGALKYAANLQDNIYVKVQSNHVKKQITLLHGCFPVNLLHIFGTHFPKYATGWTLVDYI